MVSQPAVLKELKILVKLKRATECITLITSLTVERFKIYVSFSNRMSRWKLAYDKVHWQAIVKSIMNILLQ